MEIKQNSDGSLEALEKLKGDYEKRYRKSSETWQENINSSVTQTLKKLESKEIELKNQYDTLLKMESVLMNYEKNLVEKEKEVDEKFRKNMQDFEDEKERMKKLHGTPDSIIRLNIGGHYFTTSKTTLSSDANSMLAAMFSGVHKLSKCDNGMYFIDADGTHFQWILNYLRGRISSVKDLPKDEGVLNWLKAESDFYQLSGLSKLLKEASPQEQTTLSQDWIDDYFCGCVSKSNMNFSNMNLKNISFENITFRHNATFENISLVGASFKNCLFKEDVTLNFSHADLKDCDFTYTKEEDESNYSAKELIEGKYHGLEFEDAINLDKIKADFDVLKLIVEGGVTPFYP